MSEAGNKQVVQRAFDAWAAGTGGVFDLLAPDARWTIVGRSAAAGIYDGREAFMAEVIRPFNARMSTPLVPVVKALYADGDTVIVYFDASATARDGQPYRNTYTWYLRLRPDPATGQDVITEAVAFYDSIEFDDLWARVQPAGPAAAGDQASR